MDRVIDMAEGKGWAIGGTWNDNGMTAVVLLHHIVL